MNEMNSAVKIIQNLRYNEILHEELEYLNDKMPDKWALTFGKESSIRVHFAALIVCEITNERIWMSVNEDLLPKNLKEIWEPDEDDYPKYTKYTSIKIKNIRLINPSIENWDMIKKCHYDIIDRITEKNYALNRRTIKNQNKAVFEELNRCYHKDFPMPGYLLKEAQETDKLEETDHRNHKTTNRTKREATATTSREKNIFGDTPNAYLFTWNPEKWHWPEIEQNIEELQHTGKVTLRWNCRSHKSIRVGDRAFLARVGVPPKGIFASGSIVSRPFLLKVGTEEDKGFPKVLIEFDVLLPPAAPLLTLEKLNEGNLAQQIWMPQSSGIAIKAEIVEELEALWFHFLETPDSGSPLFSDASDAADTIELFSEGTATRFTQTRYERNAFARSKCLKEYGYSCSVCGYNFEKQFGELGKNFIHVHHLTQIATRGGRHEMDPVKDLRPVCPNCHSMLHRRCPPLTIEELKALLVKNWP